MAMDMEQDQPQPVSEEAVRYRAEVIHLRCLYCSHHEQVAHQRGVITLRKCSKCRKLAWQLQDHIWGVVCDDENMMREIATFAVEGNTKSYEYFLKMLNHIRPLMADGTRSDKSCLWCVEEPHNELKPCTCECHTMR